MSSDITTSENTEAIEVSLNDEPTVIKHLVISGGGAAGLAFYGALRESHKKGFWDIKNIKSIYGTSMGSLIGTLISLNFDWDTLDNYLINRPWQNVFKCDMNSILNIYQEKGLMSVNVFEDIFSPLFRAKDIPIDITMKQLYEITNIELYIFATELNDFELIEITSKTYPNWRVIDAVYCSCCLPIVFKPYLKDNKCYADGGIIMNYPISRCIENVEKEDEIFGIKRVGQPDAIKKNIQSDDSVFDYIMFLITAILEKSRPANVIVNIKNQLDICCPLSNLPDILKTASEIEERLRLIKYGEERFLESELYQKIS